MVADFCWKNSHIKGLKIPIVLRNTFSSLCILLTLLPLVMSQVADVKTDSAVKDEMSNKADASPVFSSESEAEVPLSLGDHHLIDAGESNCHGVADKDEKKAKDVALGNEVGSCQSQSASTVKKSAVCPSGDSGDIGINMAAAFTLEIEREGKEVEREGKEACVHKDPHHSSSRSASDVVCKSSEKEDHDAETKDGFGRGDGQDPVSELGKSDVELSESRNDKTSTNEGEKEKGASEIEPEQSKLEKSDDNLIVVETTEATKEVKDKYAPEEPDEDEDEVLMGYHFNEDEVLVDKNGEQYEFRRYEEHYLNQKRYEKLGLKLNNYIYELLETRCGLKRLYIPLDAKEEEPRSFIFVSEGAFKTDDKLIIFIHGSGVVRAGQWARSLIINQSIKHGTQIPYIERALKDGYEVIVLNTNLNSLSESRWPSENELIRGSTDPECHALYVWENLIEKDVKAKHIAIVAHSYGGVVTQELVNKKHEQFCERVFAIAFTDSVHGLNIVYDSADVIKFFREHARNWVTSSLPLDEAIKSDGLRRVNDAERVSAGHEKHEWTSWSSFESIFKFLDDKYNRFTSRTDEISETPKPSANL